MNDEDFKLITDWPKCDYAVVGLILQDRYQRVCLQLRDDFDHVAGGGLWSFFGGHVEAGETLRTAGLRELNEETGLSLSPDDLKPFIRLVPDNGVQAYHYYFRIHRAIDVPEISVGEGAGFAFVHYRQYKSLEIMASASLVCEHLHALNEFAL